MKEKTLTDGKWVAISHSEEFSIRGGVGISQIKHFIRLVGSFINFVYEYFDDFKRGYNNGQKLSQ